MSAQLTPEAVMNSMLAIEALHRTPGSYLYEPEPCGWCLFIREWAAYKCEELNLQASEGPQSLRGYICITCAKQHCDYSWVRVDKVVRGVCYQCKMERDLAHWNDWEIDCG